MWVCQACGGRGGWQGPRGWIKCVCVKPPAGGRRTEQLLNGTGARFPDGSGIDRELDRQLRLDVDQAAGDAT